MRHRKAYRKINMDTPRRLSVLNSMSRDLVLNGKLITTVTRAKALKSYFEKKFVTVAKNSAGNLNAIRSLYTILKNKNEFDALMTIAERFKDRKGGYTRIIKLGHRIGDRADIALVELV